MPTDRPTYHIEDLGDPEFGGTPTDIEVGENGADVTLPDTPANLNLARDPEDDRTSE